MHLDFVCTSCVCVCFCECVRAAGVDGLVFDGVCVCGGAVGYSSSSTISSKKVCRAGFRKHHQRSVSNRVMTVCVYLYSDIQ